MLSLDNLKQRSFGDWNGQTFSQIPKKYPDGFADILANPSEAP